MRLFQKREVFKVKSVPLDPAKIVNPTTAEEFYRRGTAYYARKQYALADNDFKSAISMDGTMVDAYYGLGMVSKANGYNGEAIAAFKKVVDLLAKNTNKGNVSANMLRRLALGHVNEISEGDWNLEKEIWKRID